MADGSAQTPNLASRPAASAAASTEAHSLSVTAARHQRRALRQKLSLHGGLRGGEKDEGGLAAVTVGRVVLSRQGHLAPGDDRRQRRNIFRFFGSHRLDAGENHLAAVLEAKAARVDDGGDAAVALRLKRATRRDRRTNGGNQAAAKAHCDKFAAR